MPRSSSLRVRSAAHLTALLTALLTGLLGLAVLAPPTASSDPVPITVTVTPSATQVPSGSSLTYNIHVENTGGAQLDNVELNMQLNGRPRSC